MAPPATVRLCPMATTLGPRHEPLFERLIEDVRSGKVRARERRFAKGEVVFHEEDPGDSLHLIEQGIFAVRSSTSAGRTLIINVLAVGDVFGEFAVFSPQRRRTSTVTAITAGITAAVSRDELMQALVGGSELIDDLIAGVVGKAENSQRRLLELLSTPAELRVLRAVLLVDGLDRGDAPIALTQSDLASLAATTRPTANKVLREEAARGTLRLSRGRVTVLAADRLAKRAGVQLPLR